MAYLFYLHLIDFLSLKKKIFKKINIRMQISTVLKIKRDGQENKSSFKGGRLQKFAPKVAEEKDNCID